MRSSLCTIAGSILLLSPIVANEDHEPPEGAMQRTLLPVVKMPEKNNQSTLVSSMYALLPALGHTNWSIPRLVAFTGYAFYFQVKEGAEPVFDDNLDWHQAMEVFDPFGQVETFDTNKSMTDVDVPAVKAEARDAVVASLESGIPALVWAPLAKEQVGKVRFACWGLIVGYNPSDETYIIRQPSEKSDYPLRYDAIGFADPINWFHVCIFKPKEVDDHAFHVSSLQKALFFAKSPYIDDHHEDQPNGFAAYESWRKAFESDVPVNSTFANTESLKPRREAAAAYMRELVGIYLDATKPLEAAAGHYDREAKTIGAIFDICVEAANTTEDKAFTDDMRARIRPLIDEASEAERAAVEQVEKALEIIDAS